MRKSAALLYILVAALMLVLVRGQVVLGETRGAMDGKTIGDSMGATVKTRSLNFSLSIDVVIHLLCVNVGTAVGEHGAVIVGWRGGYVRLCRSRVDRHGVMRTSSIHWMVWWSKYGSRKHTA